MKIHQILNNNVVLIVDEQGREQIITGRGIAFNKKVNDEVNLSQIEKKFLLNNEDMNNKLLQLMKDIPIEHINLASDIVDYAKTTLGKRLHDSLYIALSDHIYTSLERAKDGVKVTNSLLWDISRFYPDEFQIGKHALKMINDEFGLTLLQDEAGFIALHIVNAQMDEEIEDVYEITKVMQEITNIVKYYFNIEFNEESVYFYRFITHLKFFAQRLIHGSTYASDAEDDLLEIIKVKYKNAYKCVDKITQFILEKYKCSLSNEEKLYLTIHIERVVYKSDNVTL